MLIGTPAGCAFFCIMKTIMKTYTGKLPDDFTEAFKDADIRGVYPSEIDEVVAYRVARAFVEEFSWRRLLVARDMRESSPSLRAAFVAGARDSGAEVVDIGLVDTPALYYASGAYQMPGVMITASHNPRSYNGLKLVKPGAVPLTNQSGLRSIKTRIKANAFTTPKQRGGYIKKSLLREYGSYVKATVPLNKQMPVKIVVDAGNGMAAVLDKLFKQLPIAIEPLFFTLDGTFPNRASNPTLAKNQKTIKRTLKEGSYDFGVSFDGDADRLAFFDERGRYINSAVVGALLAEQFLQQNPKAAFIYTVFTSRIYEETIRQYGGIAKRARVGHAFIKERMRSHDAVFACEHSAHFYFKDNYYADSGILALLYVVAAYQKAQEVSEGTSFSELLQPFSRYHQTEEVLVPVLDKVAALQAVVDHYQTRQPEKIVRYDGVTVQFSNVWFTVKPSVTEDALKYVVESTQARTANAQKKELHAFLQRFV